MPTHRSTTDSLEPQIQRALGSNYQPDRYIYRLVRATEARYMPLTYATPVGDFHANGVPHSHLVIFQLLRRAPRSGGASHHKISTWARRALDPIQ